MKTYDETVSAVFDRINDYNVKKKRRTALACRVTAACCAVSLLGGSVWYLNRPTHDIPVTIAPDENTVTTTAASTEQESTTTTVDTPTTDTTTTDGGMVAPTTTVTTVAPTQTTTKPTTGKTEPTKTTATTGTKDSATAYIPPLPTTTQPTTSAGSDRLLITGDAQDNSFKNESVYRKKGKYISLPLQQMMGRFKGEDVVFAVIVALPVTEEDNGEDFWNSNEEYLKARQKYFDASDAFNEEAMRLNPTWDGRSINTIEVWTEELQILYKYQSVCYDDFCNIETLYKGPYMQTVLDQRYETLKSFCETEPIDIYCLEHSLMQVVMHAYYAELTANDINALAELGGYTFCLATPNQKNPLYWGLND